MFQYFLVLGTEKDRIVRSDGSMLEYRAGGLMQWFKKVKIKLTKTEFDGEFEILLRNKAEHYLFDSHLTTWNEVNLDHLSSEDNARLGEMLKVSPTNRRDHELSIEEPAHFDEQADRIRALVSDPNYRFQTITNDASV